MDIYVLWLYAFIVVVLLLAGAIALYSAYYGLGNATQPVYLNRVTCSGSEAGLLACIYTLGDNVCDHDEDAGVVCARPPGIMMYAVELQPAFTE